MCIISKSGVNKAAFTYDITIWNGVLACQSLKLSVIKIICILVKDDVLTFQKCLDPSTDVDVKVFQPWRNQNKLSVTLYFGELATICRFDAWILDIKPYVVNSFVSKLQTAVHSLMNKPFFKINFLDISPTKSTHFNWLRFFTSKNVCCTNSYQWYYI